MSRQPEPPASIAKALRSQAEAERGVPVTATYEDVARAVWAALVAEGHNAGGTIVTTLCGSTRFPTAFALANMHLSLQGRIVIGLGMMGHTDEPTGARFLTSDGDESTPEKQGLDQLHYRKIDISDGIYVVNVGGYIGSSTKREIAYAEEHGKTVEWMFPLPVVEPRDTEQA